MMIRLEPTFMLLGLLLTAAAPPVYSASPDALATGGLRTAHSAPADSPLTDSARPVCADSLYHASAGELRSAVIYGAESASTFAQPEARSVPLALGMSAVIPGLGQAYNRDWVKGAVAVAVEAGLIAGYFIWKDRGLEGEEAYKAYAHAHWSPARYASWINDYVRYLDEEHGAVVDADVIGVPEGIDFSAPGDWSAAERQAVRSFFDEIRSVENELFHPDTGASFSHKLPYFAEQQYYELVGKYFQFAPGWIDYPAWTADGEFTQAIEPGLTLSDGSRPNIRGRFVEYASEHADANSLLRRASRVSAFIVLNHIVSAFDAAISAKLANDRLSTDLTVGYGPTNEPEVLASVRWSF